MSLEAISAESHKLLPVIYDMERSGVTLSRERLQYLSQRFREEITEMEDKCLGIASSYGYDLQLPKGASPNKSLRAFCFDVLKLPPVVHTDSGEPSLDKYAMEAYDLGLPRNEKPWHFIHTLRRKRKRDTALSYLESYDKFSLPLAGDTWVVYPSMNPTGTDTLRFSMSNPNGQQVSKQETTCDKCKGEGCETCRGSGKDLHSLRYIFGPGEDEDWYALDYENIELRIPAYKAGEEEMVALFERPDDPPYYGSNHLFFFDILHPEKFAEHGKNVKKVYASTWYQWTKNGDFAVQYGAVAASGTADRAYHVPGAQSKIESRLKKIKALSQESIRFANVHGYVETFPDVTVDPDRGYPLLCTRTEYGKVLETVPLSYKIQGSAMWCTRKAMVRCHNQCREWTEKTGKRHRIVLQVHDELVFALPKGDKSNLGKVERLRELMEESGRDIGVPLKVAATYHPVCWREGEVIC